MILVAGATALLAMFLVNISHGEAAIGIEAMLRSLGPGGESLTADVIGGFRMPRAVAGVLTGSALAVSGALMQGVLRNPIVSPGILGISSGSFLAIAVAGIFAPDLLAVLPVPVATAGGALACATVFLLAGSIRATPMRILLSGLIVSMTISGLTNAFLVVYEGDARYLISWAAGSLRQNGWTSVTITAPWMLGCLLAALCFSRSFEIAALGGDTATGLGQRRGIVISAAVALVLVMTGAAVATTGPIGFVGLVAPHLVKLVGVRRYAVLLPASALWGSALLLGADSLTYVFGSLTEAPPVGAVMAILGAPWLLWLVMRRGPGGSNHAQSPFAIKSGRRIGAAPSLAMLLLVVCASLMAGIVFSGMSPISFAQVVRGLFSVDSGLSHTIVWNLRLPRVLSALLAGGGFALSGALFQAALRNPLADSSLVGVNAGAAAGILLTITCIPAALPAAIACGALAGGMIAAASVYLVGWRKGLAPLHLILIGTSISAIFGAVVQIIVMQTRFSGAPLAWLVGSLYGSNWNSVLVLAPILSAGLLCSVLISPRIELTLLGDAPATSLGTAIASTRLMTGLTGVAVAAACVSQTGTVGYVGLLAPHLARFVCGRSLRLLMPASVLIGAALLGFSDMLARVVIAPAELPAGSVVAVIGAPYLLYLVYRSRRI